MEAEIVSSSSTPVSARAARPLVRRGKYSYLAAGIAWEGEISFRDWDGMGAWLQTADKALQWWIGDWMVYGEQRFGEQYAQAIDATKWTIATVKQYQYVASRVPLQNRREDLSFFHHREVADLAPEEQVKWLARAAQGDGAETDGDPWTVDRFRRELNHAKHGAAVEAWVLVKCGSHEEAERFVAEMVAAGREAKIKG